MARRKTITIKTVLLLCAVIALLALIIGLGVGLGLRKAKKHHSYNDVAKRLSELLFKGQMKHQFYDQLAVLTDNYGERIVGSENLENSIKYIVQQMKDQGLEVWTEAANVTHWVRGAETAVMTHPRRKQLSIVGLGGTVGTGGAPLQAQVVVVKSYEELEKLGESKVNGKFVLYNYAWEAGGYAVGYEFRNYGASWAAKLGAIGAFIRSPGGISVYSPATGSSRFNGSKPIPVADIAIEDANLIHRLYNSGENITISLHLNEQTLAVKESAGDVVAQIRGSVWPEEVVLISGHLDSWDLAAAPMDDACGAVLGWQTLLLLKKLNLTPQRTLRAVLWVDEEQNGSGANAYYRNHRHLENEMHVFVLESDFGMFAPKGMGIQTKSNSTVSKIREFVKDYITPTLPGVDTVMPAPAAAVEDDIAQWLLDGVPGGALYPANFTRVYNYYLAYHHTRGDTMTPLDPDEMDQALFVWAMISFILADSRNTKDMLLDNLKLKKDGQPDLPPPPGYFDLDLRPAPYNWPFVPQPLPPQNEYKMSNDSGVNSSLTDPYIQIRDQIHNLVLQGEFRGKFYQRLAKLTDTFGSRMVGSPSLSKAIDYLVKTIGSEGINVTTEEATVPKWVRGTETATLLSPMEKSLKILGLGGSVSTPAGGIIATAIVVASREELDKKRAEVNDKIVVFAPPKWHGYREMAPIRIYGTCWAQAYGALAVLIRSAASYSVYSPHTGIQNDCGNGSMPDIPAASITVEDADLLTRIRNRGQAIKIFLEITSHSEGTVKSYNTIAEIQGREKPEEIVLISGHLDSWDVGEGAMDDGAGALINWMTLSIFHKLNLRPRRTVRAVFWTSEEQGGDGTKQYFEQHRNDSIVLSMESDMGVFKPEGLAFRPDAKRRNESMVKLKQILELLEPINATKLYEQDSIGGDVEWWMKLPDITLAHEDYERMNSYYFTFHHSEADTMDVLNSDHMDLASVLWSVVAYVAADLEDPL